ncbi:hypothetical protein PILCRDRAFT_811026 [Piloderma croceum F 1598]|uniref:Uncharacterized protein n=1 Tax=Piloderma croceum (strain F 1598) TaxID=765440 RepID=A0A0C3CPX1_PILCF|nr:hypothetical protein PILCRDRAFT_811026 [Piloderma croceum F 1598]
MKFTSIFVAVGLTVCQFAAAAPKARSAKSVDVTWWTGENFTGQTDADGIKTDNCTPLQTPYRDSIQSILVDEEYSCTFYTADSCGGDHLYMSSGPYSTLPSPFPNNTLSFQCTQN